MVVLQEPEDALQWNRKYRGIYRVPACPPPHVQEREAMERYVFDPAVKSRDTWMIPTLDKAWELLAMLGNSPRKFEIIYCEAVCGDAERRPEHSNSAKANYELLGFDVATTEGEFWSIVADFPPQLQMFAPQLNAYGLFDSEALAAAFLREYRLRKLPDSEMSLIVWRIYKVMTDPAVSV
jgi:hypothetical protein